MALVWKAMKDGYGRTNGYTTRLLDGTSVYIRNTGGRRSTGTWLTYVGFGPAQVTLDRSCSLRSAKERMENVADVTSIFQRTDGKWFAVQPTASGFKHTELRGQIANAAHALKAALNVVRPVAA